jgi:iron complex outermembrane receptor protein
MRLLSILVTYLGVVSLTPLAIADTPPELVEQVTVTGTRIIDTNPTGVFTIDEDAIARSGATTLSAVFRDLVFASAGTVDEQFTQGFAPASAAANLRGMGVSRTLVLLNGRRLPIFPFAEQGSQSFVDLNLIPLGSIERIEVLKDGASAIYGADAVAGVVNIITKRPGEGTQLSARVSQASEGDGEETYLSLNTGASFGQAEIGFGIDYLDRDPIWARDRALTRSANGPIDARSSAGNPGTFITSLGPVPDPACPAESLSGPFCSYDFAPEVTLIPGVERVGLTASYDHAITPSIGLFARVQFTNSESDRDLAAAPNAYPVSASNPNNIFAEDVLAIYRLNDLGPRVDLFETDSYNLVGGITGSLRSWTWETAVGKSNIDTTIKGINGYGVAADVQAAIDSGTLNVFGPSPGFDPGSVSYQTERNGESDLTYVDIKLTGQLFELSGKSVQASFGAEYREEDFSEQFDPQTASGAIIGVGGVSADGERDVMALFAEFAVPLSDAIDITLAARYDDYSDFGSTFNPKVGASWSLTDELTLHTTLATGFKAPALHEVYAGEIFAFETVFDTTNCQAAQAANDPAGISQYCDTVREVFSIASGNDDLDAEESDSFSAGLEWSPLTDTRITIDYWHVENDDAVVASPQFYIDNETRYPSNVIRDGGGDIDTVLSPFQNVGTQKLWGIDLGGQSQIEVGGSMFGSRLSATYLGSFEQEPSPGEPAEELAGVDGYAEWRAQLEFSWSRKDLSSAVVINYTDGYERQAVNYDVDSWTTIDIQAAWAPELLRGGEVLVGVDNAFDEEPPEDPFLQGWPFFNRALHDPRGRFYFLRYSHEL